ncbi:MAG: YifB family Mg chelatase-like AAA ATPase [Desulfatiglans sp.]|jgi:magnesium chelatase family protein|nr:YifB family Mg chelatase-like AAA ATPase [Thermodesulfobacteriota bacterium]MEE4353726.1 YifB family Mg chelatase-like AAA ATPase [Desulfatiglans sp.]
MLAKVLSTAVIGIDAYIVEVEVDISQGLPSFATVGLPEGAVRESKERVKAAVKNSGYHFPSDKITVNLAPADIKKEGSAFDLPMALGILAATGLLRKPMYSDYVFLGELALDGLLRPVKGVLSMVIAAKERRLKGVYLPTENATEAAVVEGIDVYPVKTLAQVVNALLGVSQIDPYEMETGELFQRQDRLLDFRDVRGQENAKRALEVSAAGGHNLIMVGPPGSGKTMLAKRLSSILPGLVFEEALQTSKVYSVMGLMPKDSGLITLRPFRSPHHTISDAGLIGGGQNPKPGEVSLAHNGVLFLDELPEFKKNVLEVLRQPMEDGYVTISRASSSVTYPANFMLVAAMNPCPCGFFGDLKRECTCSLPQIQRYRTKISGPLMDRIDIHLEVPSVPYKELASVTDGSSSEEILERVLKARRTQGERFTRTNVLCNADMNNRQVKRFCRIDSESSALLETAMERFGLSARAHARILKISRTIADLEGCQEIKAPHVAEAIQYRTLDRGVLKQTL